MTQPVLHKIITIIQMDRQIPVINRLIDRRMQEFRNKKHRQTLSQIKNKSNNPFNTTVYQQTPKINRYSSSFIESKNLQIERENIKLFNKIASIIREKPKILDPNSSSSYIKTSEEASLKHKKRSERIKTENEIMQKRISQQKPTIKNKQFFKDRMKNIKYLKIIGRFPYEGHKRPAHQESCHELNTNRSIIDSQLPTQIQVYRKKTDDFFVRITRISNNYYVFNVEVDGSEKVYQHTMKRQTYEEQFRRCGYNYDQLLGQLRLSQKEEIIFKYLPQASQEQIN